MAVPDRLGEISIEDQESGIYSHKLHGICSYLLSFVVFKNPDKPELIESAKGQFAQQIRDKL